MKDLTAEQEETRNMHDQNNGQTFVITGITGQVGGAIGKILLDSGKSVRAVVRSEDKGKPWQAKGAAITVADMNDTEALTAAFTGAHGVFILLPPTFDPSSGFTEAKATIASLKKSLAAAKPAKVVVLSTIGAQASRVNLLTQLQILEQELGDLPMPIAFLRAAWFMENATWDIPAAASDGILKSFLHPLDKKFAMVATADIGRVAADLLQENWTRKRIIELEGPTRVSPNDIAAALATLLGRPVQPHEVPHELWTSLFTSQGMKNPGPRIQMLDGFNQGWICFEGDDKTVIKGKTTLETVLGELVARHTKKETK